MVGKLKKFQWVRSKYGINAYNHVKNDQRRCVTYTFLFFCKFLFGVRFRIRSDHTVTYVTNLTLFCHEEFNLWFHGQGEKVKGKVRLRTGHEGPEGDQRYSFIHSLTSPLNEVGGQHRPPPGRFAPGQETRYPLHRRQSGPQGLYKRVLKIFPPKPEFDPWTGQPVASHWIDYAMRAYGEGQASINKYILFITASVITCLHYHKAGYVVSKIQSGRGVCDLRHKSLFLKFSWH